MRLKANFVVIVCGIVFSVAFADGPEDNDPTKVRRVPPLGIELNDTQKQHLTARLADLDGRLAAIEKHPNADDVRVLRRAVSTALDHQEFFAEKDLETAEAVLDLAALRIAELTKKNSTPSWTSWNGCGTTPN